MRIPTYLDGFIKDFNENDYVEMTLCSEDKNELFEIWYYGEMVINRAEKTPFITDSEYSGSKIVAVDIVTGKEIVVFDGTKYGYNNMFCKKYTLEQKECRHMVKFDIPPSKILIQIGYSIDFDSEKDDYDIDGEGSAILLDGSSAPWEVVKRNGFDYIALFILDEYGNKTKFLDEELA